MWVGKAGFRRGVGKVGRGGRGREGELGGFQLTGAVSLRQSVKLYGLYGSTSARTPTPTTATVRAKLLNIDLAG